jgi:LCP family protein required for cell wall assembly
MVQQEKPYRLYKGGRVKGKVPAVPGKVRPQPGRGSSNGGGGGGGGLRRRVRRLVPGHIGWKPILLVGVLVILVLTIAWAVAGFLAFSSGVDAANKRLPASARAALTKSNGFLISHGTTILLLGTDSSTAPGRSGDRHSDSIMLVRTDPSHHQLSYLSIPRDLLVTIPGLGNQKINAAYQYGGPALAIKTVGAFTGVPVNHVVILNFDGFKSLIDAEGGITINVPEQILSNRFDCPFKTQPQCLQWKGWRFHPGVQHMNGEQALIYSRIRENQLNPGENDLTRAARQQAVTQAATAKLTSFSTLLGLPFDGGSLMQPLATDLSAWQLIELGWVKFRASHTLYCRLGATRRTSGAPRSCSPRRTTAACSRCGPGRRRRSRPRRPSGPVAAAGTRCSRASVARGAAARATAARAAATRRVS